MTLDLPDETLHRLRDEASRRGVTVEVLIEELVEKLPAGGTGTEVPSPAFVGAGASAHGITDRIEELLAEGFGRD